uniref:NADH-ubiquinone oxidoreductase chain 2 n=1 Tax=Cucujoidea sp. 12 KM-2017 TaxID=2219348 RepID=A0A346RJX2_9CUCU|nr:NADH dehydrogenase subunit 2 [Cucujoidea sp. 12 KM-2017]
MIFFNFLMMGTLISISSYSWFSMWMGLEINLLSIIPLLSSTKNMYSSEASLKYFITQALASIILLFSIIMIMSFTEFLPQNFNEWLIMIMNSSLLTKMGAAPFHFWFPEVIEGLNWMNSLIMLTWQKIAPMILMMYSLNSLFFISMIIVISMLISGLMGLNQLSLRKILAYSSINHIGWMLSTIFMNQSIWMNYFLIYSLTSINIIFILNFFKIFFIQQLFVNLNYNKQIKMFFSFNFLSLGGLPPFIGFLPKWLTIQALVEKNFYLISFFMVIFTLLTLFFYLRIIFNILTLNSSNLILPNLKTKNFFMLWMNSMMLMSLIFSTLIFNLF